MQAVQWSHIRRNWQFHNWKLDRYLIYPPTKFETPKPSSHFPKDVCTKMFLMKTYWSRGTLKLQWSHIGVTDRSFVCIVAQSHFWKNLRWTLIMKQKLIFVLVWACLNSLEFMNLLYIQCETILSTTLFRLMKKVQIQWCCPLRWWECHGTPRFWQIS